MHSLILQPKAILSPCVRRILVLENSGSNGSAPTLPCYADGCPGILYQHAEEEISMKKEGKNLAPIFLYGQTVKPIELLPAGGARIIVFYLYPHVLPRLFGLGSDELTDDCLDLSLLPGMAGLADRLQNTSSAENQIRVITEYLAARVRSQEAEADRTVAYAVSRIAQANGNTSLKDLRQDLKVSERTLERKFAHHVGVSPKLFARICQFRAALHQLQNQDYSKLSDVAFDAGYADQSHFIRSFREFTGRSPLEFQRRPESLAFP